MLAPEGDTNARGHPPSVLASGEAAVGCEAGVAGRAAGLDCATRGAAAAASRAAIVSCLMNRFMVFSRDYAILEGARRAPRCESADARGDSGESPRAVTRCGGISSGAGDVNGGARRVFADDAQLLHTEAERVRMQAESFGCIAGAVDAPSARTQDLLDVRPLDRGEG